MAFVSSSYGQSYWKRNNESSRSQGGTYLYYNLDKSAFEKALQNASTEKSRSVASVQIPDAEGNVQTYVIQKTTIFSEKLAEKYSYIQSFEGVLEGNSSQRISFVWSPFGLSAIISREGQHTFIQSVDKEGELYKVYIRQKNQQEHDWKCHTIDEIQSHTQADSKTNRHWFESEPILRTYRIAIAASPSYVSYWGGKTEALVAIANSINRINEVYRSSMAIQFELVSEESIMFDVTDNPLGAINVDSWSGEELQKALDERIGNSNYDVGHLFHNSFGSGNAGCIGCVCQDGEKGRGFSSARFSESFDLDRFDIDFACHEIGHQMGANHTFSFQPERTGAQVEPATGSTIMGYAGIVPGQNVQERSDPYFHHASIFQILRIATTRATCAKQETIVGSVPKINPIKDYTIPAGTAYRLEGKASDSDGDELYYNWEQVDDISNDVPVTRNTFGPDLKIGAQTRSYPPTKSPVRYVPSLERILSGKLIQKNPVIATDWETVPTVSREQQWSFVVRDQNTNKGNARAGHVSVETISLTIDALSGPFKVTSHTQNTTWYTGEKELITWNVAKTNIGKVNAKTVAVWFSADGGKTFPYVIAEGLSNNGKAEITVPEMSEIVTENGRFMIIAEGNIFLSVNQGNIIVKEELDLDKDGILNKNDNCKYVVNIDQSDIDSDGIGDACDDDMDGDGIINSEDNCIEKANPDQSDIDEDGVGDVCDDDMDGDGIKNVEDTYVDRVLVADAFTPNDDGINDFFNIIRAEKYPNNSLKVYNQLGQLVYESEGYANDWFGIDKDNVKVAQGAYFYVFMTNESNNSVKKGWVYINY